MSEPKSGAWCSLKVRAMYDETPMGQLIMISHPMRSWCPPTDVFESTDCYVIKCAISGLRCGPDGDIENAQVTVEGQTIVIRGVRQDDCAQEKCAYYQMEIHYGDFECRVEIHAPFDVRGIAAAYRDGFLVVTAPKAPVPGPHRIHVQTHG